MNKKLIFNVSTLAVTTFLLILTVFSWYVTNTEVSATGITAATGSNKLLVSSTYSSEYNTYSDDDDTDYESTFTNLDSTYWSTSASIVSNQLLLPTSTSNATSYYYTNDVSSDGTAFRSYNKATVIEDTFTTDGSLYIYSNSTYTQVTSGSYDSTETYYTYDYNFLDVTQVGSYYYISKSIYICNAEATDLTCVLRKVQVSQGTDETSNIYKSVRVYLESDNSNNIYKYYDSNDTTAGDALPATSETTIADTDPAINGGYVNDSTLQFTAPGITTTDGTTTYTAVEVKVCIWVEGQNANALATYAGTGFNLDLLFVTI